jgi:hypothetical protein
MLLVFVLSLSSLLAGCESGKEATNPTGAAAPTAEPEISYGDGFSPLERDGANSWRWMGTEGIIKLKSSNKDMKLVLAGSVPMDVFPQVPTLKVLFNGEQLDQFPAAQNIAKEYTIPAAKQSGKAYSELKIVTDKTFSPKDRDKKSSDDRKLGFSLTKFEWTAK